MAQQMTGWIGACIGLAYMTASTALSVWSVLATVRFRRLWGRVEYCQYDVVTINRDGQFESSAEAWDRRRREAGRISAIQFRLTLAAGSAFICLAGVDMFAGCWGHALFHACIGSFMLVILRVQRTFEKRMNESLDRIRALSIDDLKGSDPREDS